MTIDTSGEFWTGTSAGDIGTYLASYSAECGYPVTAVARHRCDCGCESLALEWFPLNGIGRGTCVSCAQVHWLADAESLWTDAADEEDLERFVCPCCRARTADAALGLHVSKKGQRWLYLGVRCTGCGTLGCVFDTKTDWELPQESTG